jgi:hypothetical protein
VADRKRNGKPGSFVLEVDAEWGAGKTFFMTRFAEQLRAADYLVAEINAWRDDAADDPFIAVMAAIDSVLQPIIGNSETQFGSTWKVAKKSAVPLVKRLAYGAAKTTLKGLTGEVVEDLFSYLKDVSSDDPAESNSTDKSNLTEEIARQSGDDIEKLMDKEVEKLIEGHRKSIEAAASFRENLANAAGQLPEPYKAPLFILVDELDRCRPTYAVALLERVKHLFEVSDIVFVFATNISQLRHSISGAYGQGFDGYLYLRRFFDRTYQFDPPKLEEFVGQQSASIDLELFHVPGHDAKRFCEIVFDAYGSSLREIEHVMEIVRTVATSWPHDKKPIELSVFLLWAIHYYRTGNMDGRQITADIPFELQNINLSELDNFNINSAFNFVNSVAPKLSSAMEFVNNRGNDYTERYLISVFLPELNRYNPKSPSVQLEIPALIRNAGKLQAREEEPRK